MSSDAWSPSPVRPWCVGLCCIDSIWATACIVSVVNTFNLWDILWLPPRLCLLMTLPFSCVSWGVGQLPTFFDWQELMSRATSCPNMCLFSDASPIVFLSHAQHPTLHGLLVSLGSSSDAPENVFEGSPGKRQHTGVSVCFAAFLCSSAFSTFPDLSPHPVHGVLSVRLRHCFSNLFGPSGGVGGGAVFSGLSDCPSWHVCQSQVGALILWCASVYGHSSYHWGLHQVRPIQV